MHDSIERGRSLHALRRTAGVIGAVLALSNSTAAWGQALASEHGSVSQTVSGTTITVEYYRPQLRGREMFGKQVRWGHPWTGANWATTLDVDHDVHFEGQPLPKGKYGLWMVPEPETWTVILHRTAHAFHMSMPPADDEQLRVAVKPTTAPSTEVLTWSFPVVGRTSTELHLNWSTIELALHIAIDSTAGRDSNSRRAEPGGAPGCLGTRASMP